MSHTIAARFRTTLATVKDAREAGQGSVEYIGVLLVVAVVIGLVIAGFSGVDFGGYITDALDKVFGN